MDSYTPEITVGRTKNTRGKLLICSKARNRAKKRLENGKNKIKNDSKAKYSQRCSQVKQYNYM
jgi:hypothetical protein